jgi:predicted small lipoprotein YifL
MQIMLAQRTLAVLLLLATLTLGACGQMGPLYQPPPDAPRDGSAE